MRALIKNDTVVKFPYSETQFRRENPQVSFPKPMPLPIEGQNGKLVAVTQSERPSVQDQQVVVPDDMPSLIDGFWTLGWTVRDKTTEEVQDDARQVRSQRDRLLAESDWIVIMHTEKGTNIPAGWELYRQALRDITAQAGFPFSVEWPPKPE